MSPQGAGLKGAQFRSAPLQEGTQWLPAWGGAWLGEEGQDGRGSALGLRVGRVDMLRVG